MLVLVLASAAHAFEPLPACAEPVLPEQLPTNGVICAATDRHATLLDPRGEAVPLWRDSFGCLVPESYLEPDTTYTVRLGAAAPPPHRSETCGPLDRPLRVAAGPDRSPPDPVARVEVGHPQSAGEGWADAMTDSTALLPVRVDSADDLVEIEAHMLGWHETVRVAVAGDGLRVAAVGIAADDVCRPVTVRARGIDSAGQSGPWTEARPVGVTRDGPCPPSEPLRAPDWVNPEPPPDAPALATIGGFASGLGFVLMLLPPFLARRSTWRGTIGDLPWR